MAFPDPQSRIQSGAAGALASVLLAPGAVTAVLAARVNRSNVLLQNNEATAAQLLYVGFTPAVTAADGIVLDFGPAAGRPGASLSMDTQAAIFVWNPGPLPADLRAVVLRAVP
jgi:hypothetical protein